MVKAKASGKAVEGRVRKAKESPSVENSTKFKIQRCIKQLKKHLNSLRELQPNFRYVIAVDQPKRKKVYTQGSPEWAKWIDERRLELFDLHGSDSEESTGDLSEDLPEAMGNSSSASQVRPNRSREEMVATLLDGNQWRNGGLSSALLRRLLNSLGRKKQGVGELPVHMQRFLDQGMVADLGSKPEGGSRFQSTTVGSSLGDLLCGKAWKPMSSIPEYDATAAEGAGKRYITFEDLVKSTTTDLNNTYHQGPVLAAALGIHMECIREGTTTSTIIHSNIDALQVDVLHCLGIHIECIRKGRISAIIHSNIRSLQVDALHFHGMLSMLSKLSTMY